MENNTEFTLEPQSLEVGIAKLASLDIMSMNKAMLFSKEDCNKILESCIEDLYLDARVIGDGDIHRAKRQKLRGEVAGFPFENIRAVTKQANDEVYDFKLLGIIDQDFPQVYQYSTGDFYNWHIDITPMAATRKLSFIINLNDSSEYTGGEIEFLNTDTSASNINEIGSLIVFPAFLPYRIKEITSGHRNIIVGHIHGTIFR